MLNQASWPYGCCWLLAAGCRLLAAGCWVLPLRLGPQQLQQLLRVLRLLLLLCWPHIRGNLCACHTHLGVDATLDALSVAVSAAGACKAIQI